MPDPTATRLIDRLVADTLAYQRPDPLDRLDEMPVCLTEAGRARLYEEMTRVRGTVANAIAQLEVYDQRHLHDVLYA